MIGRFFRAIFSTVGITIMVGLIFSLLIWFFGPLIGFGESRPFETAIGRMIAIAALWILCLIIILVVVMRRSKKDEALAEDIVEQASDVPDDSAIVTAELDEMKGKLGSILTRLKKTKGGRRHLYQLPWYVIIGPPGAGKTTALLNSGLSFPLEEQAPVPGVGGTRNCDWWFTNDAVMIDTAGRYTTQDSDESADSKSWLGFLKLLKKHRPRQPVNGVIIAISLSDLSQQDETSQTAHAHAIRRRLMELRTELGVHLPVYVLFTKSDLLVGFDAFFESLGKEERDQVWGFTWPLAVSRSADGRIAQFDHEFNALVRQLNAQSLDRMQATPDPQKRSLIAGFPSQFATLQPTARAFLTELMETDRVHEPHIVRGVYFTSGTQEGTPIDRMMMGMARTFGIGRQAIGSGSGQGRSYFLNHLFDRVMFGESGIVSADDKTERSYRYRKIAAIAAAAIGAIGMAGVWTQSYLNNSSLVDGAREQIAFFAEETRDIPHSPVEDGDLRLIEPVLSRLRDMESNPAFGEVEPPESHGWGLYQGRTLGNSELIAYRDALNHYFLPRLLVRLEDQMQINVNDTDILYEALKVYLMLGLQGPMNKDAVKEWLEIDWAFSFPGDQNADLRESLSSHLEVLLDQPMVEIPLSEHIVDYVREILRKLPASERLYNSIITGVAASSLDPFSLTNLGLANLNRVFVRPSGAGFGAPIPGIYTYAGFNDVFLAESLEVAETLKNEAWILGDDTTSVPSDAELLAISSSVLDLYYDDFIRHYDDLLEDLDVVAIQSMEQASEITDIMSGASSPMAKVIQAVAREAQLTQDFSEEEAEAGGGIGQSQTAGRLGKAAGKIAKKTIKKSLGPKGKVFFKALTKKGKRGSSGGAGGEIPEPPGSFVEERMAPIIAMTQSIDGAPPALETLQSELRLVHQEITRQLTTGNDSLVQSSPSLSKFLLTASTMGDAVDRWSNQIAAGTSGRAAEGARAAINARWSSILPVCQQITANYPFNNRAPADVGLQDMAAMFAGGGQIERFFEETLRNYVNTQTNPWTWRQINGSDLGLSDAALGQIQRAFDIRDAFFPNGPGSKLEFQITPEALHDSADRITLEIDGTQVVFDHKVARPVPVTWPGSVGLAFAQMDPVVGNSKNLIRRDGRWAWFRLLNAAQIRPTDAADRKRIIFNFDGRIAIFQMQYSSIRNPFSLPALKAFNCPASF